jgi:RNA polymerase sigma-70 factor (ECF subfamily)
MELEDSVLHLIRKAQQGDRGAFGQLAQLHQERLSVLAQSRIRAHYLHGTLEVDDVLQEAMSRAFQCLRRFQWQGEGSFHSWLAGIAERVILEAVRNRKRDPRLKLTDVPTGGASPSKALRRNERFDRLKAALGRLTSEYRQVIELSRLEGLKIREVALQMNRTPEATKKLLYRALEQLKQEFGDTQSLHLPDRSLTSEQGNDVERQ